ncbi:hypothetical protein L2E82_26825 [Cichorium intybus]|uniref:Uncharacterized protein n=1 Tax=Cichorium intybus TaxID=13427 RepID=A0ACB9CR67_CICIN|nr:hypothetical protein L2E82_26825 [Cichorium intybus]
MNPPPSRFGKFSGNLHLRSDDSILKVWRIRICSVFVLVHLRARPLFPLKSHICTYTLPCHLLCQPFLIKFIL